MIDLLNELGKTNDVCPPRSFVRPIRINKQAVCFDSDKSSSLTNARHLLRFASEPYSIPRVYTAQTAKPLYITGVSLGYKGWGKRCTGMGKSLPFVCCRDIYVRKWGYFFFSADEVSESLLIQFIHGCSFNHASIHRRIVTESILQAVEMHVDILPFLSAVHPGIKQ